VAGSRPVTMAVKSVPATTFCHSSDKSETKITDLHECYENCNFCFQAMILSFLFQSYDFKALVNLKFLHHPYNIFLIILEIIKKYDNSIQEL
jgi:hypothetical protein